MSSESVIAAELAAALSKQVAQVRDVVERVIRERNEARMYVANTADELHRLRQAEAERDEARAELAEMKALIAELDAVLGAGGINDLAFHIGQVKAEVEEGNMLRAELAKLKAEPSVPVSTLRMLWQSLRFDAPPSEMGNPNYRDVYKDAEVNAAARLAALIAAAEGER